MTDIDRIRAVLDQLATDTAPGETDHIGTYDAYQAAIDAISRIAYPDHIPDWYVQSGHVEWETP